MRQRSAQGPVKPLLISRGPVKSAGRVRHCFASSSERAEDTPRSEVDLFFRLRLELPQNTVVAAVYRQANLVTPRGDLIFEPGDHVFLISSDAERVGVGCLRSLLVGIVKLNNPYALALESL